VNEERKENDWKNPAIHYLQNEQMVGSSSLLNDERLPN
jgi:hypothetical protein